jgi:predicted acetyltransferase
LFLRHFLARPMVQGLEIDLKLKERFGPDRAVGSTESLVYGIYPSGTREMIGYVSLRLGESPGLYYLGHIGYRVEDGYRGHGYAAEAVHMLLPLMRKMGLRTVVITTDTDNIPSRKTSERLGCVLERVVTVPPDYLSLCMMSPAKCRYILAVVSGELDEGVLE